MLLDHFRPPISRLAGWKGFLNQWAAVITADLNERLPAGWRAQAEVEYGIEIDVGVVEGEGGLPGEAVQSKWQAPAPTTVIPLQTLQDIVEIRIQNPSYNPDLVAAIELVSPANKDRADHREAFVNKCLSLLSIGVGLIVVDVVTERSSNLHAQVMERLNGSAATPGALYAAAYRPRAEKGEPTVEVWESPLKVGETLPTMPLCLRVGPVLGVDLQATYLRTCEQLRLSPSFGKSEPQNIAG